MYHNATSIVLSPLDILGILLKDFIYLFLEGEGGREKGRETLM